MRVAAVSLGLAVMLALAAPVAADFSQTYTGNNGGGTTWHRPVGGGPTIRMTDFVHYRWHRFTLLNPSACTVYSTQGFDGYLHLYAGQFNPAAPLTNLVGGDDDGELGVGTSRIPEDQNDASIALPAGVVYVVVSGYSASQDGPYQVFVQCNEQPNPTCYWGGYPREKSVCLLGQFAVKIDQVTNSVTGEAVPVPLGSQDSAFFWFYADSNYEVLVKVLDACGVNGYYWVFFAATTNQGFRLQVGQVSGPIKTYTRSLGPPAAATTDVTAFPCP